MNTSSSTHTNDRLRQERIRRNWRQQDVADLLGTTVITVKRWERGTQQPGPYFRLKLCALFDKSAEELGFVPKASSPPDTVATELDAPVGTISFDYSPVSPDLWTVPYARNPFFTGREEILDALHKKLNREHTTALTQSWAISGLGGIGKTQIALEYAYRYRQNYHCVFWINAATRETLLAGLVTIVEALQLPEKDEHDQNRLTLAVKKWLATHDAWLLILDNADDMAIVHAMLPVERPGHLLLTSRAQALGSVAQRIEVETMGMAEATLFLLRRAKLLAPNAFLDQVAEADLAGAEAIATEVDFLPLALDQAGAYIEEVGCSLSTYLELYRTHRKELLQRRGHIPTDHPESVATTWSLNFQKIEQTNPAAADLLCLYAFLEPDAIPEELISEGGVHPGSVLSRLANDALLLNEAIEALRRFSLIQRNPETRLLRIHRLVQAVLKDNMELAEQRCWAERAVRATSMVFPESLEMASWPQCQRYLPLAQACSMLLQEYAFTFEEAASLLQRAGTYLRDFALYEQAELLFQRALRIYEQIEPEHPAAASSLNALARLHQEQGNYEQAEQLYQQALCIWELAPGPEHPDVAYALGGLATLYQTQGKYEQAEPLFQRALHIWELALGPEHPNVAQILNNLANLCLRQGKYERAEQLYQQAWHIREAALGPEHPEVATPISNLATLYYEQGKYEQAEPLFRQALHIRELVRGPEHPEIALTLQGLADLYREQGKHEQAEVLYQRVLHICQQTLGLQHPFVAESLHAFAVLREAQGQPQQAASLYQRALAIWEKVLGPQHPATIATRTAYIALLGTIGQHEEVASLLEPSQNQ